MGVNIVLLPIALLSALLFWCWWVSRIENFTAQQERLLDDLTAFNTVMTVPLMPYLNKNKDGYIFPKGNTGDTGERGAIGATGDTGERGEIGATGDTGERGEIGATGYKGEKGDSLLNGNTDLFKKKEDLNDGPQPSMAYTTLFD